MDIKVHRDGAPDYTTNTHRHELQLQGRHVPGSTVARTMIQSHGKRRNEAAAVTWSRVMTVGASMGYGEQGRTRMDRKEACSLRGYEKELPRLTVQNPQRSERNRHRGPCS